MMNKKNLQVVILAAGKSVRFKSRRTKLVHALLGKPLMVRIMELAYAVEPSKIFVVVGENREELHPYLCDKNVTLVCQNEPLGTGHALAQCEASVDFDKPLLVMNADTPLMKHESLKKFVATYEYNDNTIHLLSADMSDSSGYGRIIRNSSNDVVGIKEESECSEIERKITEINIGFYLFTPKLIFSLLKEIAPDNVKGEYYLTDAITLAIERGIRVFAEADVREEEAWGINTRLDLARAERILRLLKAEQLMNDGVTIIDTESCYIHEGVIVGQDSIIYPGVIIEGSCQIGEHCTLYSNIRIRNTKIGNGVEIYDHTAIEGAEIGDDVKIGPFARVRPETHILDGAKIGNFVELKKTVFGKFSKANHLSYLGDAVIGEKANIGAGTITCNYDGYHKYQTLIEDEVFVGSDTQFVAPVKIGKGAYIAAGSTITKDVPEYALGVSRGRQENKLEWVKRKKKQKR